MPLSADAAVDIASFPASSEQSTNSDCCHYNGVTADWYQFCYRLQYQRYRYQTDTTGIGPIPIPSTGIGLSLLDNPMYCRCRNLSIVVCNVSSIHDVLYHRPVVLNASAVCRNAADTNQRAHGISRYRTTVTDVLCNVHITGLFYKSLITHAEMSVNRKSQT